MSEKADASREVLYFVGYGIWAVVGLTLVLIMLPAWRNAWRWFK